MPCIALPAIVERVERLAPLVTASAGSTSTWPTTSGPARGALVTGANAGDLWDLRCDVRERLLPFLASRETSLPRLRAALPVG